MLNNAGTVYSASGDAHQAADLFREALAAREAALGPEHLEVAYTLANLAMVSAAEDRTLLIERALTIFDRQLGQAHTPDPRLRLATSFFTQDPRDALALIAPGCEALGRFASDRTQHARCMLFLGHHAREAGDQASASAAFREVDEIVTSSDREKLPLPTMELTELRGRAALATGRYRAAVTVLRDDLAELSEADNEWWQRGHRAELQLQLGLGLQALGQRTEAGEMLRAAVLGFGAAVTSSRTVLLQQRLAGARATLAAHLLASAMEPAGRAEAAALLDAAEQFYRSSGPGYAWRLPALSGLRGTGPAVDKDG